MRIFTIGYEKATQAEVIAALEAAGVKRLIDVRAIPASRRPGFSKNILARSLAEHDIDYVHLRALGTPAEGREAARKGKTDVLARVLPASSNCPRRSRRRRVCSIWRRRSLRPCFAMSANRRVATARCCSGQSPKRRKLSIYLPEFLVKIALVHFVPATRRKSLKNFGGKGRSFRSRSVMP